MRKPRSENIVGKVFDYLTVIDRAESRSTDGKRFKSYWKCKCICGKEKEVRGEHLRSGITKSCGCRKTSEHKLKRIFDAKYVVKKNGCWEWIGYKDKDGYPKIGEFVTGAHRYSYERFKEPIPQGMIVCHSCDNPSCVNPDHLWLGTQKENIQDKMSKRRHAYGTKVAPSKLTDKEVMEIHLLDSQGIKHSEIARKYNVNHSTVTKAVLGKTWKHIPNKFKMDLDP